MRGEGGPTGPPSFPRFKFARPAHAGRAAGRSERAAWNRRVSFWLPRRFRAKNSKVSELQAKPQTQVEMSGIDPIHVAQRRLAVSSNALHHSRQYFSGQFLKAVIGATCKTGCGNWGDRKSVV